MIPIYIGNSAFEWLQQADGSRFQAEASDVDQTDPQCHQHLEETVRSIIAEVRREGDRALRRFSAQFGDTLSGSFLLDKETVESLIAEVPLETRQTLQHAERNIRIYAQAIKDQLAPIRLDRGGFEVGLDFRPVERVACYVPGGRYPLPSTALMTAVTAHVAGVPSISMVCPALKPEILYAGSLAGVSRFYHIGGAQAVAALAYGTESIEPVDMVVGPGNAYVTEAKRLLQGVIGIDMLAGPSEVAVIADEGADAEWVALDLLAQAEHDPDARAYLFTTSDALASKVGELVKSRVHSLKLPDYLGESLSKSVILVLSSLDACVQAANTIAPEHLELQVADPWSLKPALLHYGALFLGYAATVPFGDYLAGPNHTLPTGRTARFSGCLNPLTFLRPQSWISVSNPNTLAPATESFAKLEGLTAHAAAAHARIC